MWFLREVPVRKPEEGLHRQKDLEWAVALRCKGQLDVFVLLLLGDDVRLVHVLLVLQK